MNELTDAQIALLHWLGTDGLTKPGECYAPDLDQLVDMGLAKIHCERGPKDRVVTLTHSGYSLMFALNASKRRRAQ